MMLADRVWNTLERGERKLIIFAAYPDMAEVNAESNSRKQWQDLGETLQGFLSNFDWSMFLGRNLNPEEGGVWLFHCDDL